MARLLVNIDVPDLAAAQAFYTAAWGVRAGRRLGEGALELLGLEAPVYLLANPAGSRPAPDARPRDYGRHWSPVHLDLAVDDLDAAITRAEAAGSTRETPVRDEPYGRIATFADPFGHGFCLIQFNREGYDALA
jgi:predicted enzyme related to lactoylglutathione lyase